MSTAKRNNAIKTLLEATYGKGKVWVRGSRGTGYGWVTVYVDVGNKFEPVGDTEDQRTWSSRKMHEASRVEATRIQRIIAMAKIEIGTYGYDSPGSDYGYGSKINIEFRVPFDVLEKRKEQTKTNSVLNYDDPQFEHNRHK
jgi:hypothetical protein